MVNQLPTPEIELKFVSVSEIYDQENGINIVGTTLTIEEIDIIANFLQSTASNPAFALRYVQQITEEMNRIMAQDQFESTRSFLRRMAENFGF